MELKSFVRANVDRVVALGLVLAGVVALVVGWFGVSGTGLAAEQLPYLISGGIGGVVFVVVGCALWVSADIQDEWRRLDTIEEHLEALVRAGAEARDAEPPVNVNGRTSSRRTRKPVS